MTKSKKPSSKDTANSPEKPRAFLIGVMTATLLSDIETELRKIAADDAAKELGGQPRTDKIELPHNKRSPKGADHGLNEPVFRSDAKCGRVQSGRADS